MYVAAATHTFEGFYFTAPGTEPKTPFYLVSPICKAGIGSIGNINIGIQKAICDVIRNESFFDGFASSDENVCDHFGIWTSAKHLMDADTIPLEGVTFFRVIARLKPGEAGKRDFTLENVMAYTKPVEK